MPLYNVLGLLSYQYFINANIYGQVTLKENASHEELDKAKEKAKADGGNIKHVFTLIKGFT